MKKSLQLSLIALSLAISVNVHAELKKKTTPVKSEPVVTTPVETPKVEKKPAKDGVWIDDKIKFTGQVRTRSEFRRNLSSAVPAVPSQSFEDFSVLLRSRLGVEFFPVNHVSFLVQVQDSREFGEEATAAAAAAGDDEGIDLHQGYIDLTKIGNKPFNLRIGRQEIKLGAERLVGVVDWNNVGRSFDAMLGTYDPENYKITAFASIADKITAPTIGDAQYFGGINGTWKKFPGGILEGYYLILQDNNGATGAAAGSSDTQSLHTIGTHVKAEYKNGIDFDIEAAVQVGKFGANSILAHAEHVNVGYTFSPNWKPRLAVEYNYATGDNTTSARYTKFNQLFPSVHNKYGFMDMVAWSNMHDIMVGFSAKPGKFMLGADYHLFMVDKNSAASDTFAGYAGSAAVGKLAGHEVDLVAKWTFNKYFDILAGYSHFFPGGYFKDRGMTTSSDFFYVQAQAQF